MKETEWCDHDGWKPDRHNPTIRSSLSSAGLALNQIKKGEEEKNLRPKKINKSWLDTRRSRWVEQSNWLVGLPISRPSRQWKCQLPCRPGPSYHPRITAELAHTHWVLYSLRCIVSHEKKEEHVEKKVHDGIHTQLGHWIVTDTSVVCWSSRRFTKFCVANATSQAYSDTGSWTVKDTPKKRVNLKRNLKSKLFCWVKRSLFFFSVHDKNI